MTPTRLQRITCPRCGRDVAARHVRDARVNHGRGVPAMRVPMRHKQPVIRDKFGIISGGGWCPAGEGRR